MWIKNILLQICFHLLLLCFKINAQISPCPNIFEFNYNGNELYGIATLPVVAGDSVKISFAVQGVFDKTNSGELVLAHNTQTVAEQIRNKENIKYKLIFPKGYTSYPQIVSIKKNEHEVCGYSRVTLLAPYALLTLNKGIQRFSNSKVTSVSPTTSITQQKPVTHSISSYIPSVTSNNDIWFKKQFQFRDICGKKPTVFAIQTVLYGYKVHPGEYPWLVALKTQERTYFCAGTLVSNKHVVTAAHCFDKYDWALVELGRYNISNRNENFITRVANNIKKHPNYRKKTAFADIAIITFSETVTFTEMIKPICIWSYETHNIGERGTFAGWGVDENFEYQDVPKATDVDIVGNEMCRNSDRIFQNLITDMTFCAGGNKSGPCYGDSGAGLVIEKNNRWYLKGITSVSLAPSSVSLCDVNRYAVYCDVGKYLNWLKDNLT